MRDDSELMGRARRGDREALSRLLEESLPALRASLAGRIGAQWQSKLDADDVVQVTCLEAFLYIDRFGPRGPGSFVAWLRQIAEHNLRDAIRGLSAGGRRLPVGHVAAPAGEDSYVALYEYLGAATTTPSRQAAREEARVKLLEACGRLPEDYRRVVELYDLQQQGVAAVAEAMERSPGAVFMLRARAHDRLRELLGTASRFLSTSA